VNTDLLFRIAILVLVIAALSVSGYFRRKAARASNDTLDRRQEGVMLMIALRVAGFGMWLATLVYVVYPDSLAFARLPLPEPLRWLGLSLSVSALPLIVWMFRSLGGNITDTVATRRQATLSTRGPYRWIRHPLYSFGGLFFVGICLMTSNGLIVLLGVGALTLLALRTPNEEARLIERFGDSYRVYMKQTGRFVPRLLR
jgi:protein-S-isoprenylcysteine O-methyltransferase Ste14